MHKLNKTGLRLLGLVVAALLVFPASFGQQGKNGEALKKKEKVERSYKKAYQKARKKTIRHRREIQTQKTRERMDAADKRADTYNKQGDPKLLERVFKRKRNKK